MRINLLEKIIGSAFFSGYIPLASGTFGSIVALLIYYFVPNFEKPYIIFPAIIVVFLAGIHVGTKFEIVYGKDPAECTIDEVAGMWISLLFIPKDFTLSLIAFIVWRAMDIIKPFPAKKAEVLDGGLGIMLDDVISGIYSLFIVQLIFVIFRSYLINS